MIVDLNIREIEAIIDALQFQMVESDSLDDFDDFLSFENKDENDPDYQPDLYYYWDSPIEEDYDWRDTLPNTDCLCEICFDIFNREKKIKWNCKGVG